MSDTTTLSILHQLRSPTELPASILKLLEILNDPHKSCHLCMELAVTIDVGEPFVKATYRLESDGPLVFSVMRKFVTIRNEHYPNVFAVARKLTTASNSINNAFYNQLVTYSMAYTYFFRPQLSSTQKGRDLSSS